MDVAGYEPEKLREEYDAAEGDTPDEKLNSMRREKDAQERRELQEKQNSFIVEVEENLSEFLAGTTPADLKAQIENVGLKTEPLGHGGLAGLAYEEGGGYRTHYRGDGYIQYHPAGGHHGDEYYKTSSAKHGTRWFRLNGEEFNGSRK